jgi:hypothetical protein
VWRSPTRPARSHGRSAVVERAASERTGALAELVVRRSGARGRRAAPDAPRRARRTGRGD